MKPQPHIVRLLTLALAQAFVVVLATGCDSTPPLGGGGGRGGAAGNTTPDAGSGGSSGKGGSSGLGGSSGNGGEPGQICGGLRGVACAKGSYCNFPPSARCGAADATGLCATIPQACDLLYAPVCGCDGKTYGNACEAAGAGTSVSSEGACAPPPGSCVVDGIPYPDGSNDIPASDGCNSCSCAAGTLHCTARPCALPTACGARAGNTCTADQYCAYTDGQYCGQADAEAVCKPRPNLCPTIYLPVCGCDGKTYANSCAASLAGSGVMHTGPCAGSGRSCIVGGVTYPDGTSDIAAEDGCNVCSCSDGVLGCTKKACVAPKPCGGFAGFTCDATEYCAYVEGQLCGAADASAVCKPRPDGCTTDVNPVCGCDGKTYSNSCAAAVAGFGYSSKVACPP